MMKIPVSEMMLTMKRRRDPEKMQMMKKFVGVVISVIGWLYLVMIVGILPFYYTEGYGYIGSDKARFFKTFGFPLLIAGFVGMVIYAVLDTILSCKGKAKEEIWSWIKGKFSLTDIFILCYAAVMIISYFSTEYKDTAWYGYEKWPNGLVPHLMVVISYFMLSRFMVGQEYFFSLIRKVFIVVFVLAVLDRLEIRPLNMDYANFGFLSTIGNINWFCGYWSVVVWIPVISYWTREVRTDKKDRFYLICDGLVATLGLFTGLIQGSDSGVMSMAVVFIVMFCMSVENGDRMQRLFELAIMTCVACFFGFIANTVWAEGASYLYAFADLALNNAWPWLAGLVLSVVYVYIKKRNVVNQFPKRIFQIIRNCMIAGVVAGLSLFFVIALLNTLLPSGLGPFAGKGVFTFDELWGSSRGGTWAAAVRTWWDQDFWHKLVGVGPDGMWGYISGGGNLSLKEAVAEQFGDNRLLNAHGEWLTNLANLGVLGAVSFAGFMISFICRAFKKGKENHLLYIFAFTALAYTVNNVFSFQTTMNLTHIFIMMGIGEHLLRKED